MVFNTKKNCNFKCSKKTTSRIFSLKFDRIYFARKKYISWHWLTSTTFAFISLRNSELLSSSINYFKFPKLECLARRNNTGCLSKVRYVRKSKQIAFAKGGSRRANIENYYYNARNSRNFAYRQKWDELSEPISIHWLCCPGRESESAQSQRDQAIQNSSSSRMCRSAFDPHTIRLHTLLSKSPCFSSFRGILKRYLLLPISKVRRLLLLLTCLKKREHRWAKRGDEIFSSGNGNIRFPMGLMYLEQESSSFCFVTPLLSKNPIIYESRSAFGL